MFCLHFHREPSLELALIDIGQAEMGEQKIFADNADTDTDCPPISAAKNRDCIGILSFFKEFNKNIRDQNPQTCMEKQTFFKLLVGKMGSIQRLFTLTDFNLAAKHLFKS